MGYFIPSKYTIENAIRDLLRYSDVALGYNYVMKEHGDYVEINIDADNAKGHVSYDLYFDEDGRLVEWKEH